MPNARGLRLSEERVNSTLGNRGEGGIILGAPAHGVKLPHINHKFGETTHVLQDDFFLGRISVRRWGLRRTEMYILMKDIMAWTLTANFPQWYSVNWREITILGATRRL